MANCPVSDVRTLDGNPMAGEDFDIDSLAVYLHLTPQQVGRLADRGKLPGRKVAGAWRFSRAEIHHWLEERIGLADEDDLVEMEGVLEETAGAEPDEIVVADLLAPAAIAVPLAARTRNKVITAMEPDATDPNHRPLLENRELLETFRLADGRGLEVVELPMPEPVTLNGERLPASYANFLIANGLVLVPVFGSERDGDALEIIRGCFPDREVQGIDCRDVVVGLGTLHCLSQQVPRESP